MELGNIPEELLSKLDDETSIIVKSGLVSQYLASDQVSSGQVGEKLIEIVNSETFTNQNDAMGLANLLVITERTKPNKVQPHDLALICKQFYSTEQKATLQDIFLSHCSINSVNFKKPEFQKALKSILESPQGSLHRPSAGKLSEAEKRIAVPRY